MAASAKRTRRDSSQLVLRLCESRRGSKLHVVSRAATNHGPSRTLYLLFMHS